MQTFTTSGCRAFGHPEITLQLVERTIAPVQKMLLGYFEQSVQGGSRFAPGQTVQVGSATLRLCARADGTIGVEERDATGWSERCDRSLMNVWMQKEIVASVGLLERLAFPTQDQTVMASHCALRADAILMTRQEVDPETPSFSGWSVTCAEEHDHGERRFPTVLELTTALPHATKYLALPTGTTALLVAAEGGRVVASVFADGQEVQPHAASYLAALNAGRV